MKDDRVKKQLLINYTVKDILEQPKSIKLTF